jgi:hypothetical protein
MSNSVTPLNLTAAALSLLQTRSAAALSSVKSAVDAERKVADMVARASDTLAQQAAGGTAIPRGQILNILV